MEKTSGVLIPVVVKRGEAVPENAIPLTDTEILDIQERRINNFQPQSEVRVFKYGQHVLGSTVALSGFIINNMFRNNFRLGGLKLFLTYGPTLFIPTALSVVVHELDIRQNILLGRESCPTCVSLRSGAYHALMGLCYPYVLSILSCLPVAREYYTLPLPTTQKGMGYLRLLHHVSPSRNVLLGIGLLNMFVGMEISRKEMKVYLKHFSKPPSPSDTLLQDEIFTSERID